MVSCDCLDWDLNNGSILRTQNEHIAVFNKLNKPMASMADYYVAGKSSSDSLMHGLQSDFSKWVVTSDRIIYPDNSLEANIISYVGSSVIKPLERQCSVPACNYGPSLEMVLATKKGLSYLQTLFNTNDDATEMVNTITRLSGTDSYYITVWNSGICRKRESEQAIFLILEKPNFYIFECSAHFAKGKARGKTNYERKD